MPVETPQQDAAWVDPRIRRTRRMLQEALERLLATTPFEKISVGEIADEATLNRATFYDHYADKFELLEGFVSTRFQELLEKRGVVFDGQCSSALMGISLAMCDFLAGMPGVSCPDRRQIEKYFEAALIAVVRDMILFGLRQHPPHRPASLELTAAVVSGAVYGGVNEWLRTPGRGTAEEAVQSIYQLVGPILHSA